MLLVRLTRMAAVCFALGLLAACRGHPQREGDYDFTPVDVISDGCGFLQSGGTLGGGTLILTGNELAMSFERFQVRLVGRFLESVERFTLDGSVSNLQVNAQGQNCVADLLTVHLDAATATPDEFTGNLRIDVDGTAPCSCVVSTTFRAVHR